MPIPKERAFEIEILPDERIDTSEAPEAGEEFFKKARLISPPSSAEEHTIENA